MRKRSVEKVNHNNSDTQMAYVVIPIDIKNYKMSSFVRFCPSKSLTFYL